LQREERLTDWDEELASLDAVIAQRHPGDADGDASAGHPPEINVRQLTDQRHALERIEMGVTASSRSGGLAGRTAPAAATVGHAGQRLRGWCRL
jgi:hypothetical protein